MPKDHLCVSHLKGTPRYEQYQQFNVGVRQIKDAEGLRKYDNKQIQTIIEYLYGDQGKLKPSFWDDADFELALHIKETPKRTREQFFYEAGSACRDGRESTESEDIEWVLQALPPNMEYMDPYSCPSVKALNMLWTYTDPNSKTGPADFYKFVEARAKRLKEEQLKSGSAELKEAYDKCVEWCEAEMKALETAGATNG